MMSFLQPKSVLHLVIISFVVVIAPLCLTILYTVQTLGELSENSRNVTSHVVSLNRQGQGLQRDLLDLERRVRQYMALKSTDILVLFNQEKEIVLLKIARLTKLSSNTDEVLTNLSNSIEKLALEVDNLEHSGVATQLVAQFDVITQARREFSQQLGAEIDQKINNYAADSDKVKDSLLLMVFLMALATLLLMLFFSYWISRPIKMIAQEIKLLGEGDLTRTVNIQGPYELKALGYELEWLRGKLAEIDQQKKQFLRHISHELKTPLANLREGADLLAEQVLGPLSSGQSEVVSIVQQNSIELQRLIENLLDFNKIPHQVIRTEMIELDKLGHSLIENYHISIGNKGLKIATDWRLKTWIADRNKLKIALDNVISNAVNYTPEKGSILLESWEQNGNLIIDVANSGNAIKADEVAYLFEPFYQGSSKRLGPIKGSGLGLSVAFECMEAQGGHLSLEQHSSFAICFRLICPTLVEQ